MKPYVRGPEELDTRILGCRAVAVLVSDEQTLRRMRFELLHRCLGMAPDGFRQLHASRSCGQVTMSSGEMPCCFRRPSNADVTTTYSSRVMAPVARPR